MGSAVASRLANNTVRDALPVGEGLTDHISSETLTKEISDDAQNLTSSSSYNLASHSQLSSDVDRWIRGNTSMESTGVQNSRVHLVQRSTLATGPSLRPSGIWYVLAMILPLFSINTNARNWRCNPCAMLTTAEMVIAHIRYICEQIRDQIRRLALDQIARELFATAMDIVVVVYAVGFLILSMYQASMIG